MSPPPSFDDIARPRRTTGFHFGDIPRLGLASRGDTNLSADLVLRAIDRGVRYLNWCGRPDGMSEAIRALSPGERERILIAVQLEARKRGDARLELERYLAELGTSWIDVITHYWVESEAEWDEIDRFDGALLDLLRAMFEGQIRQFGITTHQRRLAAQFASRHRRSVIMVRYNAAHTGAEDEVFPAARAAESPVIAYTALRWGALLRPTPDDPPGFVLPTAPECYRFVLAHPAVTICLAAPNDQRELEEDLSLLDDPNGFGLEPERYWEIRTHGLRVRRHAGAFP